MASVDMLVVVSYDISDNKRRRRLAKYLEKKMTRVQMSVFEGRFDAEKTKSIARVIEKIVETGDSVRIYSIGSDGLSAVMLLVLPRPCRRMPIIGWFRSFLS